MKKLLALLLALMMVFTFAACGADTADDAEDQTAVEEATETVVYHCVTEATFPPFDTVDEDGNIIGFDMDLMNAIAADQGFEVDYTDMAFDSLIPAVEAHQYDIITAGMNAEDPERQEHVTFSTTYYDSALMVVVKEESEVTGEADITADMKVGSQTGTTGADECLALVDAGQAAEAVILDSFTDVMLQLKNGDIQAVIIDKPVAQAYLNKIEGFKMVGDEINAEAYGFAVAKDNTELLDKINTGLQNMIDNGTYDALIEQWFN